MSPDSDRGMSGALFKWRPEGRDLKKRERKARPLLVCLTRFSRKQIRRGHAQIKIQMFILELTWFLQ